MKFNLIKSFGTNSQRYIKMIMRTFVFLFCTIAFSLSPNSGFSQDAGIKIDSGQNISVEGIFNLIKKQTKFQFVYDYDMIKDAPVVSVNKGTIKASQLLNKGLSQINCSYEFSNETIIVKKLGKGILQDTIQVSGTVTDIDGVPLVGVTIIFNVKSFKRNYYRF